MLCQKCNKKQASVFISTIVNGKHRQIYLCSDCAKEYQKINFDVEFPFSIKEVLSNIDENENIMNSILESDIKEENRKECPKCHTTFGAYKISGKLGCSKCYSTFEEELKPILQDIYGYSEHIGKFPKNAYHNVFPNNEIKVLKENLNMAIENEEYERAAELRDQIKELENCQK